MTDEYDAGPLKADVEENERLRSSLKQTDMALSKLKAQYEVLEDKLARAQATIANQDRQIKDLASESKQSKEDAATARKDLKEKEETLTKELTAEQVKVKNLSEHYQRTKALLDTANANFDALSKERNEIKAKLEALDPSEK